jgi:C4-dicarboxylate-specific signal transduction histidine kinase
MAATALRLGAARRDEMVDLRATMEQVRIVLQPVLENAGIELVWNIAERLPRVCANHSALLQIFINLARNSECATRESSTPQLSVTATGDSQGASIVVCDNGPGVAHPENLFRPFRSESGGTGLGLYVSRTTVRSFGGDMWHEPETTGACFRIRLRSVSIG